MINEKVLDFLKAKGYADRLTEHKETIDTVEHAAHFHTKPSMIARDQVESITGFAPGGVCPFNVPKEIPVWLDVSMKRFEYIHPAGGNEFTSVKLTPSELEEVSGAVGWCDVCKGWEE